MSHRTSRVALAVVALLAGIAIVFRLATADKGGSYDPDRPEHH